MASMAEAFGLGRGGFGREGVLKGTGSFPENRGFRMRGRAELYWFVSWKRGITVAVTNRQKVLESVTF